MRLFFISSLFILTLFANIHTSKNKDLTQLSKTIFTTEEQEYLKQNPLIKVGHSSVFEPLFFKDSSGNLNGIIIDTYKTLSEKLGFDLEFIDKSWKEIINDLKNGNIDVIPTINKKIVQKENLLEAEPISKASYSVFTKDSQSFEINSIEDLYGKEIAFNFNILSLKSSLKKYEDKIKIRGQKTTLEAFFLLENNKVDAVITFHRDKYILGKYEIKDIHSIYRLKEFQPNTAAAVKPNDKILQSIINKSINSLSLEEKNTILKKWLGDDSQKNNNNQLTKEEIDFLKTKNEFNVCSKYKNYPIDAVENGKLIGIAGQIYDEISKKLNIKFIPITSNSLEEFKENINKDRCDLISMEKNSYTGYKDFIFTKPMLNQFYVSIGSINNPYISNLSQLNNHTFYTKDEIFKNQFLEKYPKAKVIVNSNIDEIMKIIKNDSKSHFILTTYIADETIRKYGPDKFKIDDIFDSLKANGAILVNNKYPLLHSSINKTINDFSNEQLNSFASNYRISKYVIEKNYEWLWYILFILLVIIALLQFRYIKILDKKRKKENELTNSLKQARKIAKISSFVNDLSKDYYEEIDDSIYDIFEISPKDYPKISRKLLIDFIHPDDKEKFKEKLMNSYTSKEEQNAEVKIITPAKKVKYIMIYWKMIHNKNKEAIKTIATVQDITEKVLNEKERIQQAFLLQKQSKLALQGEMLNMIAHQWRQPLNQLSVLTQMFIRKVEPNVAQKDEFVFYKNTTTDILKHLSQTIEDFCNFYKPNKKKEAFLLEEFYRNLEVLISNRVENLIIEYNNLEKLKIYTFKNELLQVFLTMINNSIEAVTKDKPNFYIKIYNLLENEKLIIKIEDNAGGISENVIENIFEPYFSTKEEKNGTGLGLYMSKLIIENSVSGKINVTTQDDITIFTIEIPLKEKDKNE
ncbi:transporter substrate-binding domain-containing protein [Arcobacter arenosus]|uniref:transporter substrate-binding domain-containing protein n=1 Tax=Arcobacter arenosus TaxID=2576037 RepID=UPI003BA90C8D